MYICIFVCHFEEGSIHEYCWGRISSQTRITRQTWSSSVVEQYPRDSNNKTLYISKTKRHVRTYFAALFHNTTYYAFKFVVRVQIHNSWVESITGKICYCHIATSRYCLHWLVTRFRRVKKNMRRKYLNKSKF